MVADNYNRQRSSLRITAATAPDSIVSGKAIGGVNITLRFFALMRERIGESERTVAFPAGSNVADVMRYVADEFTPLAPLFRTSMVMRNHAYVDADEPLADGDEIAFI